jgi:hypothetical protein
VILTILIIPVCKPGGYPSVIFTGFPARAKDNATGCARPDESGPCAREATLRRLIYPTAGGHPDAWFSPHLRVVIPAAALVADPADARADASAAFWCLIIEQPPAINHGGGFCARRAGIHPRLLRRLIYLVAGGHPGGSPIQCPVVIPRTVPTGSPTPVRIHSG